MSPNQEQRAALVQALMVVAHAHFAAALLYRALGAEQGAVDAHLKANTAADYEAQDWVAGDEP